MHIKFYKNIKKNRKRVLDLRLKKKNEEYDETFCFYVHKVYVVFCV